MQVLNMLFNHWQDQGEYIFPREVLENALFFNAACAMGLKNIRITRETNNGTKVIIPNYYGITFGCSGMGKNYSRDLTRSLFDEQFDRFSALSDAWFEGRRDPDGKYDKKYIKLTDYYLPLTSSVEGVQKAAQTVCDMKRGSVNVVNDEIGDFVNKADSIFTKLKTAWDSGVSEGQVNVGDGNENYFTATDVCYNTLMFGSPAPFELDQKKKDKLLEAYVSGMARRSFIYHNDTYKKSENRNPNYEMLSKLDIEIYNNYREELRSHINNVGSIKFPNDVRKKLIQYDIEKETLREHSNSLIAEDLGNMKKIEKLLGILAVLDLTDTINEEHLKYAISFTERMDSTAEETVTIKPIYIRIYNELEKRAFTARTDIVKAVKDVTIKTLDDEMVLVEEHANMLGNSIIIQENSGIKKYKLEKLSATSLERIIISTNSNPNKFEPEGFEKKQGNFENIHKITNSNLRYSAGTFHNGYINDENYLSEQNLFIIDVDDGMTIEEARELFSSMTYLICTTKSHQVEKHGEICDRFRIILPTISKFHLEPNVYREMYTNVLNALGMSEADAKCKNASRWYYGNPDGEHWYNQGELLDIRNFIPNTVERTSSEVGLDRYEEEDAPEDYRIDGAIRWFLANTSKGNRNDNVFKFGALLKDSTKINSADWEHWVRKFNFLLSEPLKERELNSTIKSIDRKVN